MEDSDIPMGPPAGRGRGRGRGGGEPVFAPGAFAEASEPQPVFEQMPMQLGGGGGVLTCLYVCVYTYLYT